MSQAKTSRRVWLLAELERTLGRLALPANDQISYLRALGPAASVDELALELDDVANAAMSVPELLSPTANEKLQKLLDELDDLSGSEHADLWTIDAVRSSPAWVNVRRRAAEAATALHGSSEERA